ncbi:MAG: helix-turn-helix domain-containing protein [Burkholderiaceae bacterium]
MQNIIQRSSHASPRCDAARCTVAEFLRWLGVASHAGAETAGACFAMRQVHAGQVLVQQGADFENLYFVRAGSFKCSQIGRDGHEQVLTFAWTGDGIGFDAICEGRHTVAATALENSVVVVAPYPDIANAAITQPALQRLLLHSASCEVERRGAALHALAAVGAEVRIARFLLQLSARRSALGYSGRFLRLTMTRRDIANYLGLAHESVSRSMSVLARTGCIRVQCRDVQIIDPLGLQAMQEATRRTQEPRVASISPRPSPAPSMRQPRSRPHIIM